MVILDIGLLFWASLYLL